ncbi:MAG: GHMP kinase [Saprospiraceae bacterium]|nr:GHMP kinase [Saprospiraceae bacterium]
MPVELLWESRAQGKLLLTAEYAVLDGALALALPVRYGQSLRVLPTETPGQIQWRSLDERGQSWFEARFDSTDLAVLQTEQPETATTLGHILRSCRAQNREFLHPAVGGLQVFTQTDFPRQWGLGTSSTLIALLAQWAAADPYAVLFDTLGGSGYDIACAFAQGPLLYRLAADRPQVQPVAFRPAFAEHLFFVFLDKKQDSRAGIRHYRAHAQQDTGLVSALTQLTERCLRAETLAGFSSILSEHEALISAALRLPRVQELYFSDFPGQVKSLGAWGGDFVLAASPESGEHIRQYFAAKGFTTCIPYADMVL